jgi:hypothetical protein
MTSPNDLFLNPGFVWPIIKPDYNACQPPIYKAGIDNPGITPYDVTMVTKEVVKAAMPSGVFRLKGSSLMSLARSRGAQNPHQVSMKSGVSYPTIHRYTEKPEELESISLKALYGFLIDGVGLQPAEVERMSFGDIFEAIPNGAE